MTTTTILQSEIQDIQTQFGTNINNSENFYSFIEENNKISGNSLIYDNIVASVNNSTNNFYLMEANKNELLETSFSGNTNSSLAASSFFTNTNSNLTSFKDKNTQIVIEDIIEELEEIIDDELEDLLIDLNLELFYKIEVTDTINKTEFNRLLNQSNIFLKPNDLDNLFKTFDNNENNEIDFNELLIFIEYIKNLKEKRKKKEEKIFKNNYNVETIINIDSRFRDNYYKTLSTDFTYILPEIQNNVKKISIGSIEMPMTHYNISSKLKNNTMLIISDSNNITFKSDISSSWEFKSQIGCLSGEFLHGGFIFDDDVSSVSYTTTNTVIPGTIEVSANLYNYKWWDGSAITTINTYDNSIIPIEFIEFNNKIFPNNDNSINNTGFIQNIYSDLSFVDTFGENVSLCGLGNIFNDESSNIIDTKYLITRERPFSHYLEDTTKTTMIHDFNVLDSENNNVFTDEQIYLRVSNDTDTWDKGVSQRYNVTTSTLSSPYEKFLDISSNENFTNLTDISIVQNEFSSDVPFSENEVNIIETSNVDIDTSSIIINKTEITNYDTFNHDILVEATPTLAEFSNNYISKSFINAIDDQHKDSYQNSFNKMRQDFATWNYISLVDKQTLVLNEPTFRSESILEANLNLINLETETRVRNFIIDNQHAGYIFDGNNYYYFTKSQLTNFLDSNHDINFQYDKVSFLEFKLVLYKKSKPLNMYTLYDTISWNDHKIDISNQENEINSKFKLNNYFTRGSPNRSDICWNNLKYVNNDNIIYPYDSSRNVETFKSTEKIKYKNIKSYTYYDLKTGKINNNFNAKKFAWLVTLPDGNYDETWRSSTKISQVENIVNDAISIAIPGAIDNNNNFAAIKEPQWYNWLNNYNNKNNIAYFNSFLLDSKKSEEIFKASSINMKDIKFSINSLTGKSVFGTKTNIKLFDGTDYELDSMITKVDTFTQKIGHTSLRTFKKKNFGIKTSFREYQDLSLSEPSGEVTPEIALLISTRKQPKLINNLNLKNKKRINSIRFNIDEYGNIDLNTNIQLKLGWVLGFRGAEYILND
tara:strand:+ start:648 stop:3785 length:3138 start_codon:yes stop_codon:yes gene_type:complete